MSGKSFTLEGIPFATVPGRKVPGQPDWRIIRADTGAHVSLAFPDADGFLFDDKANGYRLNADATVLRFASKREYYAARQRAGWPLRRKRQAVRA